MNIKVILYTIILLNFLEAFILVYGTHILDSTTRHNRFKINIKLLINIWILGAINYIFQFIPYIPISDLFNMLYNVVLAIIIMPITLYLYINKFMYKKSLGICYKSAILYLSTLVISVIVFNSDITDNTGIIDILIEKIFQFIIIFGVDQIVKKLFKRNCNKCK